MINFIFNVYIVKKDACVCGPVIRVGRVEAWRKVGGTDVSNTHQHVGIRDDHLMSF